MSSIRWAFRFGAWQPTAEEWMLAMACVQTEERERINRFVFKKDAKAALVGRLLIRKVVLMALGIPYKDVQLDRTERGKPFLKNATERFPHFGFNVSHQGEYAVLGAELSCKIGIDVMQVERPVGAKTVSQFFKTMDRQFTSQEWSEIKSSPDELQQLHAFYRFWCLKESYVKAVGIGIGYSLQRLDFVVNSPLRSGDIVSDTVLKVDGTPLETCLLQETMLDAKHIVACALISCEGTSVSDAKTPFVVLSLSELLSTAEPLTKLQSSYWHDFNTKQEKASMLKK